MEEMRECVKWLLDPRPDVLIVCAGYDGMDVDQLAGMQLVPGDFAGAVGVIVDECGFPRERVALGLEGGYNLSAENGMPAGVVATVGALCGV